MIPRFPAWEKEEFGVILRVKEYRRRSVFNANY